MMTLAFKKQFSFGDSGGFGENYIPVALPALQGETGFSQVAVFQDDQSDASLKVFNQDALLKPRDNLNNITALGPRTRAGSIKAIKRDPVDQIASLQTSEKAPRADLGVTVIVDVGLAFWNKAFRKGDQRPEDCIFGAMGYMQIDADEGSFDEIKILDRNAIVDRCRQADDTNGNRKVVIDLAKKFPDSMYANGLGSERQGHGTIIADQILEPFRTQGGRLRPPLGATPHFLGKHTLLGLELPAAAYFDTSGATLLGLTPQILTMAKLLALRWFLDNFNKTGEWPKSLDPTVVIAYAGTGGPHDGHHPMVKDLAPFLSQFESVHVPNGNALQDRLHARLPDGGHVGWMIPPDDASPNTIEMTVTCDEPYFVITSPTGQEAEFQAKVAGIYTLCMGHEIIGGVDLQKLSNGAWRMVFALTATRPQGRRDGRRLPSPPVGRWTITNCSGAQLDLWIRRDDALLRQVNRPRKRQSYFDDPHYVRRTRHGGFPLDDQINPDSVIHREGTAAVLTTSEDGKMVAVGATEVVRSCERHAWYSGLPYGPGKHYWKEVANEGHARRGVATLANGKSRIYRATGTSIAVARDMGRKKRPAITPPPPTTPPNHALWTKAKTFFARLCLM